jgi:hypothetical protein
VGEGGILREFFDVGHLRDDIADHGHALVPLVFLARSSGSL